MRGLSTIFRVLLLLMTIFTLTLSGLPLTGGADGGTGTGASLEPGTPDPAGLPYLGPLAGGDHVWAMYRPIPGSGPMSAPPGWETVVDYGDTLLLRAHAGSPEARGVLPLGMWVVEDIDLVDMLVVSFPSSEGEPAIPDALAYDPSSMASVGEAPLERFLVQFIGPVREDWKAGLRDAGLMTQEYFPRYAFTAEGTREAAFGAAQLEFVRWVGHFHPYYRLHPFLQDVALGEAELEDEEVYGVERAGSDGVVQVNIVLAGGGDTAPAEELVEAGGGTVHFATMDSGYGRMRVTVPQELLTSLASAHDVTWVEPYHLPLVFPSDPTPPADVASWVIQSGEDGFRPAYDNGIYGQGEVIANADTGIDPNHYAYYDTLNSTQHSDPYSFPLAGPDPNHRKIVNIWGFGDYNDNGWASGHGTSSAGVNAGNSTPHGGQDEYNGMAMGAKISMQDIADGDSAEYPNNFGLVYQTAYSDGAMVHSGSLASAPGGAYVAESMEIDRFHYGHQDFIAAIANHNYGPSSNTVCEFASSKNVVSVGASLHGSSGEPMDAMKGYSGRGPTDDGRIKPTITAPTDVQAPSVGTTNGYGSFGGTSCATPVAAGGMVLVHQYFRDGFYPTGQAYGPDSFNATGALMRAALINGASENMGSGAHSHPYSGMEYPNNDQGFGRMNLNHTLYFTGDSRKLFVEDNETQLGTGQYKEQVIHVDNDDEPLEVTLAWTDYWGQPGGGDKIVNDLDLEVIPPGGSIIYRGNRYDTDTGPPYESEAGGNPDTVNVEENVLRFTPEIGSWKIIVRASTIAQGPTQNYALVVTGNITPVFKPDFVITGADLAFPGDVPPEGLNASFNVTVHNIGNKEADDVTLRFLLDGGLYHETLIDLPRLGSTDAGIDWVTVAGHHTIEVIVDPLNETHERVEDNNNHTGHFFVNALPVADIEVTPAEVYTSQKVTIDGSGSTDDGDVVAYQFFYGNGEFTGWKVDPVIETVYPVNGTYTIELLARDERGVMSRPAMFNLTVLNRLPRPTIFPENAQVMTLDELDLIAEDSYDPDGTIVNFTWDFSDGSAGYGSTVTHAWLDDGNYTVSLEVIDDDGEVNGTFAWVEVLNRGPGIELTPGLTVGNRSTTFTFTANGTDLDGSVARYLWDFGDGAQEAQQTGGGDWGITSITHRYSAVGEHTVSVTAEDDDGAVSEAVTVVVTVLNLAPRPVVVVDRLEALTGEEVAFSSEGSSDPDGDDLTFSWTITPSDETTPVYDSTGPSGEHTFPDDGAYVIALTAADPYGDTGTEFVTVEIINRPPVVVLVVSDAGTTVGSPATVDANGTLSFDASGSSDPDGHVAVYSWNFDDGRQGTGATIDHFWLSPGSYEVVLTVTDDDGSTVTAHFNVDVRDVAPTDGGDGTDGIDGGDGDRGTAGEEGTSAEGVMSPFMLVLLLIAIIAVVVVVVAVAMAGRKKAADEAAMEEMGEMLPMDTMEPVGPMPVAAPTPMAAPMAGPLGGTGAVPMAAPAVAGALSAGGYAGEDLDYDDYGAAGASLGGAKMEALPPGGSEAEAATGDDAEGAARDDAEAAAVNDAEAGVGDDGEEVMDVEYDGDDLEYDEADTPDEPPEAPATVPAAASAAPAPATPAPVTPAPAARATAESIGTLPDDD